MKPGDTVVVERHNRSKGETRFLPKKYTVAQEKNGSLVLNDEDGVSLKRDVSQTKRVHQWRDDNTEHDTGTRKYATDTGVDETNNPAGGMATGTAGKPDDGPTRDARKRKPPSYLSDYVRSVQEDGFLESVPKLSPDMVTSNFAEIRKLH